MPIGQRPVGHASGPAVGPRLLAGGAVGPGGVPAPPGQPPLPELWEHHAWTPAELAVPVTVNFSSPATKLVIAVRDPVAVYIGLGHTPDGGSAHGYDLVHPGNGLLSFPIPATGTIGVLADPGLSAPVDVWALAGSYDLRIS